MSHTLTSSARVPTGFHVVRLLLSFLLLSAAALKAYALWTDPVPAVSLFTSPRWQIALIELETLLGLWLLIGLYPRGAWLAAVVAFSLLAGVSLYLGLIGQPSCGCFGKVAINPWYTFALDVVAVTALWHWRPRPASLPMWLGDFSAHSLRPSLYLASGVTVMLAAGFAALCWLDPSLSAAFAFLRGESLTVEPSILDIGSGARGEVRDFPIEVRNHTERRICILGGRVGCSCIETEDLPLIVPAREARSFKCKLEFRGRAGNFQHPFALYTDDETQPVVIARVAGNLVETPGP
jgi:hypothetical protein